MTKQVRLKSEELEQIFKLYEEGMAAKEIGELLGRSRNSVISAYNRHKFSDMPRRREPGKLWTDDEHDIAVQMWRQDFTIQQIAEKLGRDRSTVSSRMTKFREHFPKKGQVAVKTSVATTRLEKPSPDNTVIEYEYREIPFPEDAMHVPFIDLEPRTCKWILEDFWTEPSVMSPCCGKTVMNYKGSAMQKNYCETHWKASIEVKE